MYIAQGGYVPKGSERGRQQSQPICSYLWNTECYFHGLPWFFYIEFLFI